MRTAVKSENVADILAIQALKAAYFRCVDTRDWEGLTGLFTRNATVFFPEQQDQPQPINTAIALYQEALANGVSVHHGHNPEIDIISADYARGIWAMEDRITWPNDKPSSMGLEYLHGYGHYHDEYRKVDGLWFIESLKVTRLWVRATPPARSVS